MSLSHIRVKCYNGRGKEDRKTKTKKKEMNYNLKVLKMSLTGRDINKWQMGEKNEMILDNIRHQALQDSLHKSSYLAPLSTPVIVKF